VSYPFQLTGFNKHCIETTDGGMIRKPAHPDLGSPGRSSSLLQGDRFSRAPEPRAASTAHLDKNNDRALSHNEVQLSRPKAHIARQASQALALQVMKGFGFCVIPQGLFMARQEHPPLWGPEDQRPKTGLYVLATPIGHMGDLSPRAAWLLGEADVVCAEDSRKTRVLMRMLGLSRDASSLISVHAHNEASVCQFVVEQGLLGKSVVLVSDAGTPAVCDPGARLVAEAWRVGLAVYPVPGPSALTAALSVSGFLDKEERPTCFFGFLPAKQVARRAVLTQIRHQGGICVAFEAPHRIQEALVDAQEILGREAPLLIAREMTKRFETLLRGSIHEVREQRAIGLATDAQSGQGEMVLVFGPRSEKQVRRRDVDPAEWAALLAEHLPKPAVAKLLSKGLGLSREEAYALLIND